MDDPIDQENKRKLKLCVDVAQKLHDLSSNVTKALALKEPLQQAHAALIDIWKEAQSIPIFDKIMECRIGRQHVDSSIKLIADLAKQLDDGKIDFKKLKTPGNHTQRKFA